MSGICENIVCSTIALGIGNSLSREGRRCEELFSSRSLGTREVLRWLTSAQDGGEVNRCKGLKRQMIAFLRSSEVFGV